jgi:subtilisin-like proprotein convertase family protein
MTFLTIKMVLASILVVVAGAVGYTYFVVTGRDLKTEFRGRALLTQILISIVATFAVYGFFDALLGEEVLDEQAILGILDDRERAREAELAAGQLDAKDEASGQLVTEFTSDSNTGLTAKFDIPIAGKIKKWKLFFYFTTSCENDLKAFVSSPTGKRLYVMDRGLNRCSGEKLTYSSENTNDMGVFEGTDALGAWRFNMRDLDSNEHEAELEGVSMTLVVDDNGTLVEKTFYLQGLPRIVPNPR